MYKLEGRDIVIGGFQQGIADDPYSGIADMRNVNTGSIPGEGSVNFKSSGMIMPPAVNASAYTADAGTDILTWTPGALVLSKGQAIVLNTNTATGLVTGKVYYVGSVSGSTFKVYTTITDAILTSSAVDITVNGSGTFTTYQMAKPMNRCIDNGEFLSVFGASNITGIPYITSFIIDTKNQVWALIPYTGAPSQYTPGSVIYCGNIGSTIGIGSSSIVVWNGYMLLFRNGATDYWLIDSSVAPVTNWGYSWAGFSPTSELVSRRSLAAQDDAVYVCNGSFVASILEEVGTSFDPANAATYTVSSTACTLPEGDPATCLAELGTTLLIGGTRTFIYPWDRISTVPNYPIVCPERYISLMVSTNSNAYIFAGNRGRIYITNGSNIDLYKKIPDYVSGIVQPYYLSGNPGSVNASATSSSAVVPYGDATYWRGQLYFSFTSTDNATTTLTSTTGVWAIDLTTDAMRMTTKMSYDAYSGTVSVIIPNMTSYSPGGEGLFCGWVTAGSVSGVDNSVTAPYSNFESFIETDMIPIGTYLKKFTPSEIEWKTSAPIGVNGTAESVRIYWRSNLTASWTLLGTSTATGTTMVGSFTGTTENSDCVSDYYSATFQNVQWMQLRIETSSNATTPTYTRLTEVRIRDYIA